MSRYKVGFYANSNANAFCTNAEVIDLVDDYGYTEKEAEANSKKTYKGSWNGLPLTRGRGTIMGPSGKETYYNLDMSTCVSIMRGMGFSARKYPYAVRADGVKTLGGYVMVAANLRIRPKGSFIKTSLGTGIVVDTGGFAAHNPTQLDIATNW